MEVNPTGYDRILMNPPFERKQDEKHIRHAMKFLNPGGVLVGICSSTTATRLTDIPSIDIEHLPAGSFANSDRPTQVNTAIITIRK